MDWGKCCYLAGKINEFLVMAYKDNILRYGEYDFGNQYAVEMYRLFSEQYAHDEDE